MHFHLVTYTTEPLQAAHPLDVLLLPMLERLLAAGYQRMVLSNVWVARRVGHGLFADLAPATLLERFDPIRDDDVFDLRSRNG